MSTKDTTDHLAVLSSLTPEQAKAVDAQVKRETKAGVAVIRDRLALVPPTLVGIAGAALWWLDVERWVLADHIIAPEVLRKIAVEALLMGVLFALVTVIVAALVWAIAHLALGGD